METRMREGTAVRSFPGRENKLLRSPKQPGGQRRAGEEGGEKQVRPVGTGAHRPGVGTCGRGTVSHTSYEQGSDATPCRWLDSSPSRMLKVTLLGQSGSRPTERVSKRSTDGPPP